VALPFFVVFLILAFLIIFIEQTGDWQPAARILRNLAS
jgi:hypothetical protein